MIRQIINIDESKCNGCGICAEACHEGAIGIVDGKAKLLRDDYCDGLGDCLPTCPTGAITFVQREAADYDEAAVAAHMENRRKEKTQKTIEELLANGCPGSQARELRKTGAVPANGAGVNNAPANNAGGCPVESQLTQWPVQIKLAPLEAPYFDGADLLIAADCTAYAYGNFHNDFIAGRITLIGCPKLDNIDYSEKLTEILKRNSIKSITLTRMTVPCCGGLENAVERAIAGANKDIPLKVVTISTEGEII